MQTPTNVAPARPATRTRRARVAVLLAATTLAATVALTPTAVNAQRQSGGWTTDVSVSDARAAPGETVTIWVTAESGWDRSGLVDVEIHSASEQVAQMNWDDEYFDGNTSRTFTMDWSIPSGTAAGEYEVEVGVFSPGWEGVEHWNWLAATIEVTSASTGPAPAPPGAPAPARPDVPTGRSVSSGAYFSLLPPGSYLPGGAECANAVGWLPEVRPENNGQNNTTGHASPATPRVTGNYTGTTEMIIRWGACKWGLDENMLRAQVWQESEWRQDAGGDRAYHAGDPENCGAGQWLDRGYCAESVGLSQVRSSYYPNYDSQDPWLSTAYNVDLIGHQLRSCFNGEWRYPSSLFDRGYGAGDMDGCVGFWFAGQWHSSGAEEYLGYVREKLWDRPWERL